MSVGICSVCGCPQRPWLKPGTVAVALSLSGRHVRHLLASTTLRGVKLGKRCWRVEHASVDAYVQSADNRADEGVLPAPEGVIAAPQTREDAA